MARTWDASPALASPPSFCPCGEGRALVAPAFSGCSSLLQCGHLVPRPDTHHLASDQSTFENRRHKWYGLLLVRQWVSGGLEGCELRGSSSET